MEDTAGTRQSKERQIDQYRVRIEDLTNQHKMVAAEHTEKLEENENCEAGTVLKEEIDAIDNIIATSDV